MASVVTGRIEVKGLKQLEQALIDIGGVTAKNVFRQSMLKAVTPLVEAARANALGIAKSGSLALAMGSRFRLESEAQPWFKFSFSGEQIVKAAVVSVGPLRNDRAARAVYTVYYRRGKGGGKLVSGIRHGHLVEFGTRRSRATPFLRPAADATQDQIIGRFVHELRTRIEKVREKQARLAA